MSNTPKLENLLTALFGDDIDAEAAAKRIRDEHKQKAVEALNQATKIMELQHTTVEDIPSRTFRYVTLQTLINRVKIFREEYQLMNRLHTQPNDQLIDNAKLMLAALRCYQKICILLNEPCKFSAPEQRKLDETIEWTKAILPTNEKLDLTHEIQVFAHMVFHDQVRAFCKKKQHTIRDAATLVAAQTVRGILTQPKYYNVPQAEQRITDLQRYAAYKKIPSMTQELLMLTIPSIARKNLELFDKASKEIDDLLNHTQEVFGYTLNYIKSGQQEFNVFKWHSEIDDGQENERYQKGSMWAEDKGTFPTLEEAKAIADEDDEIEEYDPEEMWAIVDPNGNNPTNMIYPYKERAAVFLIGILGKNKLPNWYAWEDLLNHQEG